MIIHLRVLFFWKDEMDERLGNRKMELVGYGWENNVAQQNAHCGVLVCILGFVYTATPTMPC